VEYSFLGNTGLKVSRMCVGALTIGPLQANLSLNDGAMVIAKALENGINFIDTAELYRTYAQIKKAIETTSIVPIIATKTYAYDRKKAEESLEKARSQLGLDVIDIFMLHEQESIYTIKGHMEALEYFIEAKQKGLVRSVGVSTHNIEVVRAGAERD